MASLESPVKAGDVLAGKYRVEHTLGLGGMGIVVLAQHLGLDAQVALKFMLTGAAKDADSVERFTREARAAFRLKSEHCARILDVGVLPDGPPYIVMEYLKGEDLGSIVARTGPLSLHAAVKYILQACDAIAEAHSLGIVHRDLKPSNLFLTHGNDGEPLIKVLDFGLAKTTAGIDGAPGLTQTTAVMGSPHYMSPEQMRSTRDVDARTDIWSLGAALYELIAGKVPFSAETMPELVLKVVSEPHQDIRELRPDVPDELVDVIQRALEKDRAKRYQNIGEFARALGDLGDTKIRAAATRPGVVLKNAALKSAPSHKAHPVDPHSETELANFGDTNTPATLDAARHASSRTVSKRALIGAGAGAAVLIGLAAIGLGSMKRPAPTVGAPPPSISAIPSADAAVATPVAVPVPTAPPIAAPTPTAPPAASAPVTPIVKPAAKPAAAPPKKPGTARPPRGSDVEKL